MQYALLILILLGAVYLLVRTLRRKSVSHDGLPTCDRCSRVAQPPSEKLYQITIPEKNEDHSAKI